MAGLNDTAKKKKKKKFGIREGFMDEWMVFQSDLYLMVAM